MDKDVVLITTARSGSNVIKNIFEQSESFIALGEILRAEGDTHEDWGNIFWEESDQITKKLAKFKASNTILNLDIILNLKPRHKIFFKVFFHHVCKESELNWRILVENKIIIHLIRQNPLETFVSLKMAEKTGVWVIREKTLVLPSKESNTLGKIYISPAEFLSWYNFTKENLKKWQIFLKEFNHIKLVYSKKLYSSSMNALTEIVESNSVNEQLIKQNDTPLSSIVQNYKELMYYDDDLFKHI